MVGRSYTMKEMKQIVEYLVEHRVYNEIRGRKMWMDLASSKIIDRTWQSLKETFLKRILPDIHNPYYKLTVEQICSFRQEVDIAAKNRSKLEIQTISDDSSTSDNQRTKKQATKKEDEKTGEEKCTKIQNRNRSSTDTLVLENCYENAEDIRKELESPTNNNAQKSFRDFITYSEPLTPMLQEVLHDFSSDDEPKMQIVEEPEGAGNNEEHPNSESPETLRESQSYTKTTENSAKDDEQNKNDQPSKIKSLKLKKTRKGTWENKEPDSDVSSTVKDKETNNNESDVVLKQNTVDAKTNILEKSVVPDKNNSNSTTDTPLPNNQEELANKPNQNRTSTESSNSEFLEPRKKKKEKSRKRSHSQSSGERRKKKKEIRHNPSETPEPEKDTQTFDSHPQATNLQKELDKNTLNTQQNSNNQTDDTNISPNVVVENTTGGRNEGTSQEAGPSGVSPADINPCLKTVSLFEELFSQSKYSDSDEDASRDNDIQVKNKCLSGNNSEQQNINNTVTGTDKSKENISDQSKEITVINKAENPSTSNNIGFENVLLLNSHSETSSEPLESPKQRHVSNHTQKSKEMALANLFGFTSGGVKKPLNNTSSRRFSQKQKIVARYQNIQSGSSDDYTSASDSEGDTPPTTSRHNGHSRRFKKPPSYDILTHEDGLFVVGRNKIYPLILGESGARHYARCAEDKAAEQADSYWKAKYLDERKKRAEETIRADELARLLRKTTEEKAPVSPILQANQSFNKLQPKQFPEKVEVEQNPKPEENVKIKFNRNKEVELEGQWTNLNPILERMVQLFNSNDSQNAAKFKQQEEETKTTNKKEVPVQNESKEEMVPTLNAKPKNKKAPPRKTSTIDKASVKSSEGSIKDGDKKNIEEPVVISSGKSTPLVTTPADNETHKKVDKIESEIFEKIAEIDKTDQSGQENEAHSDTNITKRKRGRPRKISEAVRSSASLDAIPNKRVSSLERVAKKSRTISVGGAAKNTRTFSVGAEVHKPDTREVESDAGTSKRSTKLPKKYNSESNLAVEGSRTVKTKSKLSLHKPDEVSKADEVSIPEDDNVLYKFPVKTKKLTKYNKRSSINERSLTSPDVSSRHSESTPGYQDSDITPPNITKRRKRSTVSLVYKKGCKRVKRKSCPYLADDDSCSTNESLRRKSVTASDVSLTLNSEVYRSDSYQMLMHKAKKLIVLDKIDENTLLNEIEIYKDTSLNINANNEHSVTSDELGPKTSEANSSNMSYPLSPELSIVENLSVSKDLINNLSVAAPTINETQGNDIEPIESPNKYLISDVDVSMPLMGQECEIQTRDKNKSRNRRATFSESFPHEQYSSESLDQRLRDLLLESAKKIEQGHIETHNNKNVMEIDNVVGTVKKRRSSTPRKKKTVQRSKTPNIDPVLEEHTESCSRGGRKSCPPVIHIIPCEETDVNVNVNAKPRRVRNKKEVIKVKILRPRSNSRSKERIHTSIGSVCTDSGINGTESGSSEGCQCCDVTTELIHNHSDTCLHMEECVGDSVEFVEDTNRSVISLNSYSIPSEVQKDKSNASKYADSKEEFVTPDALCSNARDATSFNSPRKVSGSDVDDVATVYHTPQSGESFNSMITDDLSDESKPPSRQKWYLLSEDDTNFADARSQSHSGSSFGANLNKIFTPCAVPNLSTISERSKENDTKNIINTDNDPDTISQSVFDLEF